MSDVVPLQQQHGGALGRVSALLCFKTVVNRKHLSVVFLITRGEDPFQVLIRYLQPRIGTIKLDNLDSVSMLIVPSQKLRHSDECSGLTARRPFLATISPSGTTSAKHAMLISYQRLEKRCWLRHQSRSGRYRCMRNSYCRPSIRNPRTVDVAASAGSIRATPAHISRPGCWVHWTSPSCDSRSHLIHPTNTED
jgi:hypothetical protein